MSMKNFHMKRFGHTEFFFIHIKIVLFHLSLFSFIFFYFFFFWLNISNLQVNTETYFTMNCNKAMCVALYI